MPGQARYTVNPFVSDGSCQEEVWCVGVELHIYCTPRLNVRLLIVGIVPMNFISVSTASIWNNTCAHTNYHHETSVVQASIPRFGMYGAHFIHGHVSEEWI